MPDPRPLLAALAVLAAALLTSCAGGASADGGPEDRFGLPADGLGAAVLPRPWHLADTALTDAAGRRFETHEQLAGRQAPLTLLFFGYTHCDDVCPAVMANVTAALGRLDDAEADQVAVWFVTTDPARDDSATLRRWLGRFDPGFEGLTGPMPRIARVADSARIGIEEGRELPSGGYEVLHGTPVLGVRADGSVPLLWSEDTSAAQLATDLHKVLSDGVPTPGGTT